MNGRVAVIDAGVGNLGNVVRALRHLGADPEVVTSAEAIGAARQIILPGVGAFAPPRERLAGEPEAALRAALAEGAWLLGICVGFQLLFDRGEEHQTVDGLGLLRGAVRRLPETVPIPHIGWNRLHDFAPHPLLEGIEEGSRVYFVHSYAVEGEDSEEVLARCTHGHAFPAISGRGRVLGCQFHPEKSGAVGLRLLRNFLRLAGEGATS